MKRRPHRRSWSGAAWLGTAALALWAAGALHVRLAHPGQPAAGRAATNNRPAPPLVTFTTVMLGGFRGILADMLWLRVSTLQEEGRYFELVQLADWITKLEPYATAIWSFHAWNLAYNISAVMADDEDRWRWVQNGIRLLRDEGIVLNPDDPELYRDLGWLFQNKIGANLDTAHLHYKRQWAALMTAALGGARPDYERLRTDAAAAGGLRAAYGLDVARMRAAETRYGPLDWRLPQPHALYWASEGLRRTRNGRDLGCERMLYQSLADTFRRGTLTYDATQGVYQTSLCPAAFPPACTAYERTLNHFPIEAVHTAYRNFLGEAVERLFGAALQAEAAKAWAVLQARYPAEAAGGDMDAYIARRQAQRKAPPAPPSHAPSED